MAGVDALAGEGRFRQLYVDRDRPSAVGRPLAPTGSATWPGCGPATRRSTRAGSARSTRAPRALRVTCWWPCATDWAVMTRQFPRELTLVGMHGSLTADEMTVPLFVD